VRRNIRPVMRHWFKGVTEATTEFRDVTPVNATHSPVKRCFGCRPKSETHLISACQNKPRASPNKFQVKACIWRHQMRRKPLTVHQLRVYTCRPHEAISDVNRFPLLTSFTCRNCRRILLICLTTRSVSSLVHCKSVPCSIHACLYEQYVTVERINYILS
jgi:hypothetical protein